MNTHNAMQFIIDATYVICSRNDLRHSEFTYLGQLVEIPF